SPWLDHILHLSDEVLADPNRVCSGAKPAQEGTDGRGGQWRRAQRQAREEARSGAARDLGHDWERLSIQREGSVGVAHGYSDVPEDELELLPGEPDHLVPNLSGSPRVVEPNGPQVPALRHC